MHGLNIENYLCNMEIVACTNSITGALRNMEKAALTLRIQVRRHMMALAGWHDGDHLEDTLRTSVYNTLPYRGLKNRMTSNDSIVCTIRNQLLIAGKAFTPATRTLMHAGARSTEEIGNLVSSLEVQLDKLDALVLPFKLAFS
jgi:hypothetical protein